MKYLINIETKEILKESSSIGQAWVDMQPFLELLDIEDAVANYVDNEDGTITAIFRRLEDSELEVFTNVSKKENKQIEVGLIEVEYNGIAYQGDETSQDRISRTINGLSDDTTTITWKAKDNSQQELTRIDLKKILFMAIQEQTKIWFS